MSAQTIYDPTLGELNWNDDDECWVSQVQFGLEHLVNITIDPEEVETGSVILKAKDCFLKLQSQEETNIRRQIADKLLSIYNDNWNEGDAISNNEFIDQIKLEDIVFYADSPTQLFYNDGDLFAGHCIVATVDSSWVCQDAEIMG